MKSVSDLTFLRYGYIPEVDEDLSFLPSVSTISLKNGQMYQGKMHAGRVLIKPVSGIGFLSVEDGYESEDYFIDREIILKRSVSFAVNVAGQEFSFIICSQPEEQLFLRNTGAIPTPAEHINVESIVLQLTQHENKGCFIPPSNHDLYELCYIESGHLFSVIDGQTFLLGPGELQLFLPGQLHHQYGYQEEAAVLFILLFKAGFPPNTPLTNKIFDLSSEERHLISRIKEETAKNRLYSETMCLSYLTMLLVSLQRQQYDYTLKSPVGGSGTTPGQGSLDLVNEALKILNKTPGIKAEALAKALNVSSAHLSRLVSQHTGKSISSWRKEIRMEAAKDLLRGGKSVGETAILLQFPSMAYFSSEFSKYWGISPRAYLRQLSN